MRRHRNTSAEKAPSPKTSEEVWHTESDVIFKRRRRAEGDETDTAADAYQTKCVRSSAIGMAISGGGIRSASFSLGFTQALYESGLFRHLDYMSAVSGGSYTAAFIAAQADQKGPPFDRELTPFDLNGDATQASAGIDRIRAKEQPLRVRQLIYGGDYLFRRQWKFFSTYLGGLFLNNLIVISGIIALAALLAFAWRLLDAPLAIDVLKIVGVPLTPLGIDIASEPVRPFLPALGFGIAWFACAATHLAFGLGRGRWHPRIFVGMIFCLLIGMAVWFGNRDVGNTTYVWNSWVLLLPWLLVALCVLPALRPKLLIDSATHSRRPVRRHIFLLTSTAILAGIPLLAVYILAEEDVAGYVNYGRAGSSEFHKTGDFVDAAGMVAFLQESERTQQQRSVDRVLLKELRAAIGSDERSELARQLSGLPQSSTLPKEEVLRAQLAKALNPIDERSFLREVVNGNVLAILQIARAQKRQLTASPPIRANPSRIERLEKYHQQFLDSELPRMRRLLQRWQAIELRPATQKDAEDNELSQEDLADLKRLIIEASYPRFVNSRLFISDSIRLAEGPALSPGGVWNRAGNVRFVWLCHQTKSNFDPPVLRGATESGVSCRRSRP